MKKNLLLLCLMILSCAEVSKINVNIERDVYAWCIVPFDKMQRNPSQRIQMLKKMGINKYAYDWRANDLNSMEEELKLAKSKDVNVFAVWLWIDANWDSFENLSKSNRQMLGILKEIQYQGELWVSFNSNFFDGLSDDQALVKGVTMIRYLCNLVDHLEVKVALYNHGDWFGNPINQLKIIKKLTSYEIGMVYNFHHAHHQIDEFSSFIPKILPYLWHVNVSGLKREVPKILPLGNGDYEKEMITILIEKGYDNDFGILGHVEDEDVEVVLNKNKEGFKLLLESI